MTFLIDIGQQHNKFTLILVSKPFSKKSTVPNQSEHKESDPEEGRRVVDNEGFMASMVKFCLYLQ